MIRALTFAVATSAVAVASNIEPCAQLSNIFAKSASDNTDFVAPGELAYNCLTSMPFESKRAVTFLDEFVKYLQFHSTLEILKNPPEGYLNPAVDLIGGIADIRARAAVDNYTSQFAFDNDIRSLLNSANDGHLGANLCSPSLFYFDNNLSLVSISTDGLSLPQVYTKGDAIRLTKGEKKVSPIFSINNVEASKFLADLSNTQRLQDPDARYNALFPSLTVGRFGSGNVFAHNIVWPGYSYTTIEYANGTVTHVETVATFGALEQFNYTDGTALYEDVCLPVPVDPTTASNTPSTDPIAIPVEGILPGYPTPVVRDPYYLISGYFLNETDLSDVAVLSVPTFETAGTFMNLPLPDNSSATVHQTAIDFISTATAAGKRKVVIDLSGNPGGFVLSGFDLFRLFFPNVVPFSGTRFRSSPVAQIYGKAFANVTSDEPDLFNNNGFAFQNAVSSDQKDRFATQADLFGPFEIDGIISSALHATVDLTYYSTAESPVSGFGEIASDPKTRPFDPENIIIVTDGQCSSTCTTFSELMKAQGVRSVAFGGRPFYGPQQAIGGVKGAQVAPWSFFAGLSHASLELANNASEIGSVLLTEDEIVTLNDTAPGLAELPLVFELSGSNVNFRNSFTKEDQTIPIQFVYEAAECRLFFTAENYQRQESVWAAAARAMFNGAPCVEGSTNAVGSLFAADNATIPSAAFTSNVIDGGVTTNVITNSEKATLKISSSKHPNLNKAAALLMAFAHHMDDKQ